MVFSPFSKTIYLPLFHIPNSRAQLGNAAWKLLHTMAGRFPKKPTSQEMGAMNDYIYLFAMLYPCGEW